jgi:hypothetical protein
MCLDETLEPRERRVFEGLLALDDLQRVEQEGFIDQKLDRLGRVALRAEDARRRPKRRYHTRVVSAFTLSSIHKNSLTSFRARSGARYRVGSVAASFRCVVSLASDPAVPAATRILLFSLNEFGSFPISTVARLVAARVEPLDQLPQ